MLLFPSSFLFHPWSSKPGRTVTTKVIDLRTRISHMQDSELKSSEFKPTPWRALEARAQLFILVIVVSSSLWGCRSLPSRIRAPHSEDLFKHLMKISHLQLRIYNCNYKMKNKTVQLISVIIKF